MTSRWTCPGCRESVAVTPTRRLRAHDDPSVGAPCQGKGFWLDRAAYPQYVELFGQERANEIMRGEFPGWEPPAANTAQKEN